MIAFIYHYVPLPSRLTDDAGVPSFSSSFFFFFFYPFYFLHTLDFFDLKNNIFNSMIGAHKSLQPERSFGPITMCLSMLYMFIQSFLIEKLEDFKLHVHDCEGVNISH